MLKHDVKDDSNGVLLKQKRMNLPMAIILHVYDRLCRNSIDLFQATSLNNFPQSIPPMKQSR